MCKKLYLLLLFIFITFDVTAQSAKDIEADLLKAFVKIDHRNANTEIAANLFAKKLKDYTEKYPATIGYNFEQLKKNYLDISTSSDSLFRIYSWDRETGGTMHFFESVFQYKAGDKIFSITDTPKTGRDRDPWKNYFKTYTANLNGKTYYLCVYLGIESSRFQYQGIDIFTIEQGKFNNDVKIIKTKTGLHNELSYEYDFGSIVDWKKRPEITFDAKTNTILLPLTLPNGIVTHKFITYKFTGKYFEKIKDI